jgi:hypothetical protein
MDARLLLDPTGEQGSACIAIALVSGDAASGRVRSVPLIALDQAQIKPAAARSAAYVRDDRGAGVPAHRREGVHGARGHSDDDAVLHHVPQDDAVDKLTRVVADAEVGHGCDTFRDRDAADRVEQPGRGSPPGTLRPLTGLAGPGQICDRCHKGASTTKGEGWRWRCYCGRYGAD